MPPTGAEFCLWLVLDGVEHPSSKVCDVGTAGRPPLVTNPVALPDGVHVIESRQTDGPTVLGGATAWTRIRW